MSDTTKVGPGSPRGEDPNKFPPKPADPQPPTGETDPQPNTGQPSPRGED